MARSIDGNVDPTWKEVLPISARARRLKVVLPQLGHLKLIVPPTQALGRMPPNKPPAEGSIMPALIASGKGRRWLSSLHYIEVYGTTDQQDLDSSIATYYFQACFPCLVAEFAKAAGKFFLATTDLVPEWKRDVIGAIARNSRTFEAEPRIVTSRHNLMGQATVLYHCSPKQARELLPILTLPMIHVWGFFPTQDTSEFEGIVSSAKSDLVLLQELLTDPEIVVVEIWQDWNGAYLFASGANFALLRNQIYKADSHCKSSIRKLGLRSL